MTAASIGHPSACHSFSADFTAQQQHPSPKMNPLPLYHHMRASSDLSDDDDDSALPSPPVMPAATATSDVLAPPPPPECPKLSWQFIWSFFVRAPRVRAWLFDKNPPPQTHVAQALLSSPVLCGYVFGRVDRTVSQHCFPDIGDMHTTFCRDGETLLGFHFGFNGIQPVLPMLFSIARDPMLGNPRVVVRRTALERVHLPGMPPCYLAIEFNWLESGSLSVVTNVHPIDKDPANPTGMAAYFDHAEGRVYDRVAADRLKATASRLDAGVVAAYFPSPSHFRPPPPEFLDPSDDYILITIEEPNDPVYYSCLSPANVSHRAQAARRGGADLGSDSGSDTRAGTNQHENLRKSLDIQAELTNGGGDRTLFSAIAGATLHADCGDSPSMAEEGTIVRWKAFQDLVAVARRTGMMKTRVGRKVGGLFAKVKTLYSRTAGYTFLSTSGVSVHGRVQRLCDQLGIQASSPSVDAPLNRAAAAPEPILWTGGTALDMAAAALGGAGAGAGAEAEAEAESVGAPTTPSVCEVDISKRPIDELLLCGVSGVSGAGAVQLATKVEPVPERLGAPIGAKRFAYSESTARDQAVPSLGEVRGRGAAGGSGDDGRPAKRPRVDGGVKVEGSSGLAADVVSSGSHATGATHSTRPVSPSMRSEGTVVGKGNKAVWTCEQCGVKIRGKKGNLNRHIANKHDNIRAYLCSYDGCGRRFQTRLNLVRHERAVHEGRPFVCPHCPRAFKLQSDLDGHVASAHANAGVQLACDVCGSCFARRSTLNRHKIRVHKMSA